MQAADLPIPEGRQPALRRPFKGNMDVVRSRGCWPCRFAENAWLAGWPSTTASSQPGDPRRGLPDLRRARGDREAIAQGLHESADDGYLRYRVRSIAHLGEVLEAAGRRHCPGV